MLVRTRSRDACSLVGATPLNAPTASSSRWIKAAPTYQPGIVPVVVLHYNRQRVKAKGVTDTQQACVGDVLQYVDGVPAPPLQQIATPKVAVFSAATYVLDFLSQPILDAFPDSTFIEAQLDANTALLAAGHEVVCCFVNDDLHEDVIERLAEVGVKFVAMRCAGFDRVDLHACQRLGIRAARVPTYSPASVAEHAVAMLLCLNRNLHLAHIRMWAGDYTLSGLVGFELRCKTVGILGTGAIGACAAQIFCGFGARVIAYDLYENEELKKLGVTYVSKEELLQRADVLSLHCPLLPSTYHMIDKASIQSMKHGAIIVNVSRGGLVDVDAAMDALETGQLGGLALDVYEQEGALFFKNWSSLSPLERYRSWDKKFQLLKSYPNVLISPHSAFLTQEALDNIATTTVANIKEFQAGSKLTFEVLPK